MTRGLMLWYVRRTDEMQVCVFWIKATDLPIQAFCFAFACSFLLNMV